MSDSKYSKGIESKAFDFFVQKVQNYKGAKNLPRDVDPRSFLHGMLFFSYYHLNDIGPAKNEELKAYIDAQFGENRAKK